MGDLVSQNKLIPGGALGAVREVLNSSAFISGPYANAFEDDFAEFCGASHCVGVANGTDAIEILLKSLGLPDGSGVLIPSHTFVATAEAAINVGLRPKFVDVDSSMRIDLEDLDRKFDSSISCLIIVHLHGRAERISGLLEFATSKNIRVIEDCSQAHGLRYEGRHVGTFFDGGTFSFYPGKNLGAIGDAGAIITNNSETAEICRRLGNHGRLGKWDHQIVGRNSRLDAIQAEVLRRKLPLLEGWIEQRRRNAATYVTLLEPISQVGVVGIHADDFFGSVFHQFVIRTASRDELADWLKAKGIETGIHYPLPVDKLEAFASSTDQPTELSAVFSEEILSLPVGEHVTDNEVAYVCSEIERFFRKN